MAIGPLTKTLLSPRAWLNFASKAELIGVVRRNAPASSGST